MPGRWAVSAAALVVLVGAVAVGLFVWPGLPGAGRGSGDPGKVVRFGEFAVVRPQGWSSRTLYNGLGGPGLQIVSDEVRERTSPGEEDPVKAMVGDQVALTLVPAGLLSERDDVVTIGRDDLATEGAKVPRGRAIVDRLLCGSGTCLSVHVEFARQQPSDGLLEQVNRLLATIEPAGS